MTKERKFLAYWDCLGFEVICDITTYERQKLLADIKNEKISPPINFNAMLMRARYNPQRSPEIWVFTATNDLTEEYLKVVAETTPQTLVDLIRERGNCVFKTASEKQVIV